MTAAVFPVRAAFRHGSHAPPDRHLAVELGVARRAAARDLAPEQWAVLFRSIHPSR